MPSLTLVEAAKLVQNPLQRGVVEIFARSSEVLQRMPFMSIAGNAYQWNTEETLPGVAFRDINQPYTESTGVIQRSTENLKVFGGLMQFDRALVQMQGNLNDLRATHTSMKTKAVALDITRTFFRGDETADPKSFDGLDERLTGDQVMDETGPLTLDLLDQLIDRVVGSPDVLFMSKGARRKVNSLRRAANQAVETVSDVFGRQINAYAGIPIGVIEEDSTGDPILTDKEVFAVRFGGGEYVSGLQSGPMEVIDQGLQGIFYQTLVEWILSIAVFHPRAAAKLSVTVG